jgi:DNA-3-methyladenine glycosylase I
MTDAAPGAVAGPDGKLRCPWGTGADYVAYHDEEWGRPLRGDQAIFERLCLEAFQSGLSWLTILRKRENFRKAFAGFDIPSVAAFTDADVARLLADAGIVRNRAKVNAAIVNARAALELPAGVKDLRKRGFVFTGPVTVYATMQACGLVNDHLEACFARNAVS